MLHKEQDRVNFIQDFFYRRDESFAKELFEDVLKAIAYAHQADYQKLIVITNAPERAIRILLRKIDFKALKMLSVKDIEILSKNQVDRLQLEIELQRSLIPILIIESELNGVNTLILKA